MTKTSGGFDEELLTPKQVAALFGVDPKTVTRSAQEGTIGGVITAGGHRRYRSAEVHALLHPRNSSQ
ncbi:BldC family transcriptional regulator [Rhodococcus globerulus]|uniref:BldC family transcriptional regulator n=1 Tax=Rhodococcus globerulus TaxID=33008 RepID=UPI001F2CD468|nr:BldC family transcriptional regulator [Rhodococcus globerulus]MCE4265295.1 BldC family transcriptional regulator [Rhodococcus globerulus]